jgi:hypothetical protein
MQTFFMINSHSKKIFLHLLFTKLTFAVAYFLDFRRQNIWKLSFLSGECYGWITFFLIRPNELTVYWFIKRENATESYRSWIIITFPARGTKVESTVCCRVDSLENFCNEACAASSTLSFEAIIVGSRVSRCKSQLSFYSASHRRNDLNNAQLTRYVHASQTMCSFYECNVVRRVTTWTYPSNP